MMDSGFYRRRWSFGETSYARFWILDVCFFLLFGLEMYLVLLISQKDYEHIKKECGIYGEEYLIRD